MKYPNTQVDRDGQIIDVAKHRSKLFVIEQEFKKAEKDEYMRKKEEQEMRRRVQKKRQEKLEKARLEERLSKIKEDRRIRREILALTSPQHSIKSTKSKTSKNKNGSSSSSFFLTEAQDRQKRQEAMNSIDLDEDFC